MPPAFDASTMAPTPLRFSSALFLALLLSLTGAGAPAPASAQTPIQVSPSDSAAVLLETARGFQRNGEDEVARALLRHIVARYPGTVAAQDAGTLLRDTPEFPSGEVEGSGAVELQVWSTLYGAWLGLAIPGAFGADDSEPYGLGLLVGAPTGFLVGRTAANSSGLTLGQARAITFGGTWGTWQGFGWREVFDWGVEETCPADSSFCFEGEDDGEEALAAMVVGGLVGLGTGVALARGGVSSASATGANFGALWGTWFGAAFGELVDLEGDDQLAAALVGGNAGLVAAALGTPRLGWSRDRWRAVSIGGVLGGLAGLGIDLLVQPDDEKVAIGIPLATSVVGLGIGIGASRSLDASGASEGAPEAALFSMQEGTVRLGTPVPFPVVREVPGPRGPERKAGLGLTLFQARF